MSILYITSMFCGISQFELVSEPGGIMPFSPHQNNENTAFRSYCLVVEDECGCASVEPDMNET